MGSIRLLLAMAVVFIHTSNYRFVGGQLAVQLFYIISGFLISYILVEGKSYSSASTFYFNRFLRLFPLYWIVAAMTLVLFATQQFVGGDVEFFRVYGEVGAIGAISLTLSNVFLVGQDWLMFTAVRDGAFQFVADYKLTEVHVSDGLLVPQAWSLGVEICFYLIAPFVLTRRPLVLALLTASLLVRVYLVKIGIWWKDPWVYRFFPAELALFLLGALSHQVLKPLYLRVLGANLGSVSIAATIFMFAVCALYAEIPPLKNFSMLALFGLFILSLPLLFEFQATRAWDRAAGDLSYPVYISHFMLLPPVSFVVKKLYGEGGGGGASYCNRPHAGRDIAARKLRT